MSSEAITKGRRTFISALEFAQGAAMTELLQKAFAEAAKLSPEEQDAFAKLFLAELESEQRWDELFAKSQDMLEAMAEKALRDFEQGKTKPIED